MRGYLSADDLAAVQPREVEPLVIGYRGRSIHVLPELNGGPTLWVAFEDLKKRRQRPEAAPDASTYMAYAAAMRTAWTDRFKRMGDAGERTAPTSTTHLCTIDRDGNMVTLTQTLLSLFGARIVLPKTGILMNNGINWFDPVPGGPNSIAPDRRPLANYVPAVMTGEGAVTAIGGCGGRRILPAVFQLLAMSADFGFDLEQALHTPRLDVSGLDVVVADHRMPAPDRRAGRRVRHRDRRARRLPLPLHHRRRRAPHGRHERGRHRAAASLVRGRVRGGGVVGPKWGQTPRRWPLDSATMLRSRGLTLFHTLSSRQPPPLTPLRKGEGNPVAYVATACALLRTSISEEPAHERAHQAQGRQSSRRGEGGTGEGRTARRLGGDCAGLLGAGFLCARPRVAAAAGAVSAGGHSRAHGAALQAARRAGRRAARRAGARRRQERAGAARARPRSGATRTGSSTTRPTARWRRSPSATSSSTP